MQEDTRLSLTGMPMLGLGGLVLDDEMLRQLLQKLALLALHAIEAAGSVSITIVEAGHYRTTNCTGPEALAIDEAQYADDTGPCLEAIRSNRQLKVGVDDMGHVAHRFCQEARRANVGLVLSTPLVGSGGEAIGAMNVYVRQGGDVDDKQARSVLLIAENAAVLIGYAFALMSSAQLNDQLRQAVATRELIGAAKGILMQSQKCTRDEAFDILRRASQRENRKLRDVAEDLVTRVEARAPDQGAQA